LGGSGCIVGRIRGAVLFPEDPHVSPAHAALIVKDNGLFVRDDASVSGVFVSISDQAALSPFDCFAVGNRLFRYLGPIDPLPQAAKEQPRIYGAPIQSGQAVYGIEEILVGARSGKSAVTAGPVFAIGQRACDWTIPDDPDIAPRHCEVHPSRARATLRDLSGGKGTYLRIRPGIEHPLASGDRLRIGMQTLKVDSIA
jgi:pSer/pThr/pTyr-binding forkhead associated (FHA) protein